jgi:DNA-binding SARP family transcriptional activator
MMFVHTLGTALIDAGEARVTPSAGRRFALLLHLSAEAGRRVPRSTLNELMFPDQPDKNARHSLRELVYQCRQLGVQIASDADGIELGVEDGRTDHGAVVNAGRLNLGQLQAITGGFLPGYAPEHSEAFTEWLEAFRARTTFELSKALLREITRARTVADWTTTELAARSCLTLDPLNEEATLALAEMLALNGAKTQALTLLDHYLTEVGETSRELRVPAVVLKRRISEQAPEAYVSREISPFVGRGVEMHVLREHLARAREGGNECVAIVGEAGIGKSRLVKEFCATAAFDGASVAIVTSLPHDVHRPFGAFADLLPRLLAMRGALGCSPESMRVLERLTKAPIGDAGSFADTVRDSDALCDSLVHAILDLVDAVAGEQLLVLAVEDVHWLDGMSLRVLGYLLSRHRTRKLFVLVTSRTSAPIADITRYADTVRLLEIGGLPSDAIERLTSAFSVQTDIALDDEMKGWLEDTATGNPLFLESLLAHYSRTQERFAVSPTLHNLLSRRVELLSPHAATTLQVCAMLGKHATLDTLMDALSLSRSDLIRAVGELEGARLIKSDVDNVHPAHALIADVAQARLSSIERRLAHQCVALALEMRLGQDRYVDVVWECAEHWVAAHDASRALAALRRCATQALELGRPGEAAQILARALDLEVSRDDRRLVGTQMVLAADAASEPMLVFRGYEALGDRGTTREHNEMEFAHFRACLRSWKRTQDREEDLFACVLAKDASPDHRVAAAMAIAKYADVHGDQDLAERAVHALPIEVIHSASPEIRLEFLMVRHSALREWEHAAEAARALIRVAQSAGAAPTVKIMNAGLVLLRSGFHSEASSAAQLAYAQASTAGNRRIAHQLAWFISDRYLDSNDDQLAQQWLDRARVLGQDDPGTAEDLSQNMHYVLRSLDDGDAPSARTRLERMDSRGLFTDTNIMRRWQYLLAIRLRQLEGGKNISEEEVECLTRGAATTASMDHLTEKEVTTACHGLALMGRRAQARQLLAGYDRSLRLTRAALSRHSRDLQVKLASD